MSDRDIRQHQCIEKWVHNKCKGCIEGCTGFGAPRGTIGYIFPVVPSLYLNHIKLFLYLL